jgi:hypothetical protein
MPFSICARIAASGSTLSFVVAAWVDGAGGTLPQPAGPTPAPATIPASAAFNIHLLRTVGPLRKKIPVAAAS